MKAFTYSLLLSLLASLTLTSCLKDEETTYSDYCYISAFSLGYIKQLHHTTGSKGQDSTYITSYSASRFCMNINQRENTIENADSLPYGSQISKILTTVSFQSVLVHRPKDISKLAPEDTVWVTYSSSDSIDFTNPREFLVLAADGSATRSYTVKVNVHKMNPDATVWDSLGVSELPTPAGCKERKMVALNGSLKVLTKAEDGSLSCFSRAADRTGEWKAETMQGAEGLVLETLQCTDGMAYASTETGSLLYSTDGVDWKTRMLGTEGLRLVGVSSSSFYALQHGKLVCSPRNSENWTEEMLDEDASKLPVQDITFLTFSQKNGNDRLLIVGKSADGKQARLWSKSWSTLTETEQQAGWVYYSENDAVKDTFPLLNQSNVMRYNGSILLFGGASQDTDSEKAVKPLGKLFQSQDYGITWQEHTEMTLDSRMTTSASEAEFITAALQDDKYIWVLVDGQLWRGRFNGVSFE